MQKLLQEFFCEVNENQRRVLNMVFNKQSWPFAMLDVLLKCCKTFSENYRKTLVLFNVSESCFIENACSAFSWPHPYFKLNLCFSKVKHAFPQMSSKYGSSYTEQVILQFTCVSCWAGVNIQLHSADEIVRAQGLPHHARVTRKLFANLTWYLTLQSRVFILVSICLS